MSCISYLACCAHWEGHYEMMGGVCLSVACLEARPNSRMERKSKIGTMDAHHTSNPWIRGQKVKVTRPINVVTENDLANTPREAKWRLLYLTPRVTAVLFNAPMTIWRPYLGWSGTLQFVCNSIFAMHCSEKLTVHYSMPHINKKLSCRWQTARYFVALLGGTKFQVLGFIRSKDIER